MRATIYDVAEKAGVSISTVSKVVNNTGNISEKTQKKVCSVMKQLDYQPNSLAAALTGKKTFTIGVLVPDISNPFFAEVARALENKAREMGYAIILCSTDYQKEREHGYLELLLKKRVDGIIVATEPKNGKLFESYFKQNIPLVALSVDHPLFFENVVTTDDLRGGYMAGEYLIENGHQDIAIIAEMERQSGRLRLEGYKQALKNNNVKIKEQYIINSMSIISCVEMVSKKILTMKKKPTAIFATTDLIAAVFMKEARKENVSIPEDISIIGFDNTIHAEIAQPGLTTIAQPINDLATHALTQLMGYIETETPPGYRVLLLPKLIERTSVKNLKYEIKANVL